MKKIKGFSKLAIQIALLSASMMALSFLTDTEVWLNHFNYKHWGDSDGCFITPGAQYGWHYHWNYRGHVYVWTGFIFFILTCVKIRFSHKEKDFTNSNSASK